MNKTLTLKSKVPVLFTLVMVQLISFKALKKRDKYVDTVSTKSSLRRIISEAIELSKHPLNKEQVDQITAIQVKSKA